MELRSIIESDLKAVAAVHILAFPDSGLTKLGFEAVRRYYLWQLKGPHDSFCIGAYDDDNKMVGFCFAGVFRGALSGFLQKNRSFLVWRVLTHIWLVVNPLFLERMKMAWATLKRRSTPVVLSTGFHKKSFGILSIAVNPQVQGLGYGKCLMLEVEMIAMKQGFMDMHLTVAVENYQAIAFYEKLGWQKLLTSEQSWHGTMHKHLENVCA